MTHRSISKIVVHKLFGTYDYGLSAPANANEPNRLVILYGDNGSGKTTILKLLFYLLSPETGQGHKTALATIPVSAFEVQFSTGDRVWMRRPEGQLTGGFVIGMKLWRAKERTAEFKQDDEGNFKANPETTTFLKHLAKLELALYFLSDDRSVHFAGVGTSDSMSFDGGDLDEEVIFARNYPGHVLPRRMFRGLEQRAQLLLQQSILRSERWLQSEAVRGASQGESSVNALYAEILKNISSLPLTSDLAGKPKINALLKRMANLEIRSREFARYGLIPEFHGKDIVQVIKQAPKTHVEIVTTVVTPYVESVERKLDAMEHLQKRVDTLVSLLNSFYSGKALSYDVHVGFTLSTTDGRRLQPEMLSSGERHLLLLFCNTVQALDKPSIFVIDEPEISLNIKWQRRLLSALLECSEEQPVQYFLASHSLELLAQYRNNAIRLESEQEVKDGTPKNA